LEHRIKYGDDIHEDAWYIMKRHDYTYLCKILNVYPDENYLSFTGINLSNGITRHSQAYLDEVELYEFKMKMI